MVSLRYVTCPKDDNEFNRAIWKRSFLNSESFFYRNLLFFLNIDRTINKLQSQPTFAAERKSERESMNDSALFFPKALNA
jgi:hypothetical protein